MSDADTPEVDLKRGAADRSLARLEKVLGFALPASLRALLRESNGRFVHPVMNLHSTADMIELHGEYPVREPGYLAIGDDSGGRAIVIPRDGDPSPVYLLDHGWMSVADKEPVAHDLLAWVRAGCPCDEADANDDDDLGQVEITLEGTGTATRVAIMACLRERLGLELRTARAIVDRVPVSLGVHDGLDAAQLIDGLRALGAAITVRGSP